MVRSAKNNRMEFLFRILYRTNVAVVLRLRTVDWKTTVKSVRTDTVESPACWWIRWEAARCQLAVVDQTRPHHHHHHLATVSSNCFSCS